MAGWGPGQGTPPFPRGFPRGGVFCARGDVSVTRSRLATVKPYATCTCTCTCTATGRANLLRYVFAVGPPVAVLGRWDPLLAAITGGQCELLYIKPYLLHLILKNVSSCAFYGFSIYGCVRAEHAFSGTSWTALTLEVSKSPTATPRRAELPVA